MPAKSTTRRRIRETIVAVGLSEDVFIIGRGAKNNFSEIHYRPYGYNAEVQKEYSIQYCDEIVAIWEIGRRIRKTASIDLNWEGLNWRDVHELRIKKIRIQDSDESTEVAVMPIDSFESYLMLRYDGKEKETFYTNRKEGDRVEIFTNRYERDPKLRKQAIALHGTKCQVCGFSFAEKYGKLGNGYIEVHHIKPISEGVRDVNPKTDLVCLCSNCHRMIHHNRSHVMTVDELKDLIKNDDR